MKNVLGTFFFVDLNAYPRVLYWTKNNHFYSANNYSGRLGNPTYDGRLLFTSSDCTCNGGPCVNAFVVANPSNARPETPAWTVPNSPLSVLLPGGRDLATGQLLMIEVWDAGIFTIRSQGFGPGDCEPYPPPPDGPPIVGAYVVTVSVSDVTDTWVNHPLTVQPAP